MSELLVETIGCNICGSARGTFLLKYDGYDIVRCSLCDLVFVNSRLRDDEMKAWYAEGYYTGQWEKVYQDYLGEAEHRIAYLRTRVRELRQFARGGRLLEIGCAAGFFLEAAKPHFEVEGVEISEYSSRYAREVLGHRVHTGTISSARFEDGVFDVVIMSDVIEHLTDPKGTLAEACRVLKRDGVVLISTGNVQSWLARRDLPKWKLMGPPWHLYYYSPQTLKRLLASEGFVPFHLYTNSRYTYSQNRLLNNPALGWLTTRLQLGDIMFAYCQKASAVELREPPRFGWHEPDLSRGTRDWRGLTTKEP